jgi:uncharacterized membrane protein YfcA
VLLLLGLFVGTIGTMIGAGGGFILVPILFFLYPNAASGYLTAISLAIVCLNAISGSIAYGLQKKIDYRSGIYFAAAGFPSAIFGVTLVHFVSRKTFEPIFASVLLILSLYLFFKPERSSASQSSDAPQKLSTADLRLGMFLSVFVGLISSFIGIGGGIIHVPLLVHLLKFSVHRATATSHFILALLTFAATCVNFYQGVFDQEAFRVIGLVGISVLVGAQIGARLSKKIHGRMIIRTLATALALVAIRLFLR